MPLDVATLLGVHGVLTHPNRLSEGRQGALAIADDVVLDRTGLACPRRGLPYYGSAAFGTPGQFFHRLIPFDSRMFMIIGTVLIGDDGDGTGTTISGTYAKPAHGTRVRDAESNGNLYLATAVGVKRLPTSTSSTAHTLTARNRGPLDGSASLTGSSGFLADDSSVAYKATFYERDENGNEHESAPSQRLVISNTVGGGATRNVALTFYLSGNESGGAVNQTTSHYWRIYRSAQITPSTGTPSDELQQVGEGRITSTNISNTFFTFTDITPDSLRGATLYTSPSQEGADQANEPPPLCADLCFYRGFVIYANLIGKHRFFLNLLGTGDSALRYYVDASVGTTSGNGVLTGIASTTTLRVGMRAKGTGVHASARIVSIDSATQVTVAPNSSATATVSVEFGDIVRIEGVEYFAASATVAASKEFLVTTGGTASQNIEATAKALVFVVNRTFASTSVAGFYDSDIEDAPGLMRFEEQDLGGSAFQVSSTATEAFAPTLPTTDDGSQLSLSDVLPNGLAWGKSRQPEAVALGANLLGPQTTVRRIVPLREAVIVLSDVVGIFSGTDPGNFSYSDLDSTCKLIGSETAVVCADAVYCMSTQGVVRITPSGVQIASRDIERDLLIDSVLSNYASLAFGVGYETDRSYRLCIPISANDTEATFQWHYDILGNDWSHISGALFSCGVVNPFTDKLWYGETATSLINVELKDYARTDFADDAQSVTIASSTSTTVTLSSASGVAAEELLVQGSNEVRIVSINGNTLTMRESASWSNGAATVYTPINLTLDSLPFYAGDPARMKRLCEVLFFFREAVFERFTVSFANDFFPDFNYEVTLYPSDVASSDTMDLIGAKVRDEQVIRTYWPQELQFGHWFRWHMRPSICREQFAFAGVAYRYRMLGTRFQGAERAA